MEMARNGWDRWELAKMSLKKKWSRLGLHETLLYKGFVQFPVHHGFEWKQCKSIKSYDIHEISMESAGSAIKSLQCVEIHENIWWLVEMCGNPLQWASRRRGHVWDCTNRWYINVSCESMYSMGSCKNRWGSMNFHGNHESSMEIGDNAENPKKCLKVH